MRVRSVQCQHQPESPTVRIEDMDALYSVTQVSPPLLTDNREERDANYAQDGCRSVTPLPSRWNDDPFSTHHSTVGGHSGPIHVLLLEDNLEVAKTIEREFREDGLSVTSACNIGQASAALCSHEIDVVFMELRLPDEHAEAILPKLEVCRHQPALVIVSSHLPDLGAPALEYRPIAISKPVPLRELLCLIRRLVPRRVPHVLEQFVKRFRLTRREAEATMLVARGLKAKEISDRMLCTEKTVYAHLLRTCSKVGCRDYHELVGRILAFTCQLLGDPGGT